MKNVTFSLLTKRELLSTQTCGEYWLDINISIRSDNSFHGSVSTSKDEVNGEPRDQKTTLLWKPKSAQEALNLEKALVEQLQFRRIAR
jgi:hypothetical protein